MKICVIMPSYLGFYKGAAENRESKFKRAVQSFQRNLYPEKELVIVSDGCEVTNRLYEENYYDFNNIHLVKIEKQPLFSGYVRFAGQQYQRTYIGCGIECGLDTDDTFLPNHLQSIASQMGDNDWVYFDDYWNNHGNIVLQPHFVSLDKNVIGTSSIAWKNKNRFIWHGMDGWGHDYEFITERLLKHGKKYSKITNCGYVINHIQNMFDE